MSTIRPDRDHLVDAAVAFQGGVPRDDIAVVVIKALTTGASPAR